MRRVLGTTAQVLGRRGIALERFANVTLRRDAYADEPGPTVALAIGERTTYRAGAWLLDEFDRPALGASWPAWGGTAGLLLGAGGVTAAVGPAGIAGHTLALPRDPWAAVVLGALAGPSASVGVLLRATAPPGDPADGYQVRATSAGQTVVDRLTAGGATTLATVPTTWRPGQVLRVELAWDRLRVYQDLILVLDVVDPGLALEGRHAGMQIARGTSSDAAVVPAFVGGELRQEYLGAGLDLGDVQTVLGQPVRFDLTLSNRAPMGGRDRFAALLRHGLNTAGTFDLDRGTVRVYTAVQGGTAPLATAVGVIDAPSLVSEDRVRLACRGREAFLTPRLAPGVVTYLPGPPPGGLLPLPADPCAAASPPVIDAGDVPAEPPAPGTPGEGVGPEAPGGDGAAAALAGLWVVDLGYDAVVDGTPAYRGGVASQYTDTAVPPVPLPFLAAGLSASTSEKVALWAQWIRNGAGSSAAANTKLQRFLYRGPNVPGTHLSVTRDPIDAPTEVPSGGWVIWSPAYAGANFTIPSQSVKVVRYSGAGITSVAQLEALTLAQLEARRIETLVTLTFAALGPIGAGPANVFSRESDPELALTAIPLNTFAGPQIIGLELATDWEAPVLGFGASNVPLAYHVFAKYSGACMVIRAL